jgi:spore coat protein U-like protein
VNQRRKALRKNVKKLSILAMACMFILAASSAFAANITSPMAVSANIGNSCTFSAGALAFGTYDPVVANLTNPLNGTATLSVNCTNGAPAYITLDQGLNPAAGNLPGAPARQLANAGSFLSYSLYKDAAMTQVWGYDGTLGGPLTGQAYTGTGAAASITVYGQIPGAQTGPAGTYTDTVTATITF